MLGIHVRDIFFLMLNLVTLQGRMLFAHIFMYYMSAEAGQTAEPNGLKKAKQNLDFFLKFQFLKK